MNTTHVTQKIQNQSRLHQINLAFIMSRGTKIILKCTKIIIQTMVKSNKFLITLTALSCFEIAQCLSTTPAHSSSTSTTIKIGTRFSKLALVQAHKFQTAIEQNIVSKSDSSPLIHAQIVPIDTSGDQTKNKHTLNGNKNGGAGSIQDLPMAVQGVDFMGALDDAISNGSVDVAVHSLKDIPPESRWGAIEHGENEKPNVMIGAYLGPRANPFDVLVTINTQERSSSSIESIQSLPFGARVGSSSIRRHAQLKAHRPDLQLVNIRGNVDARIKALENEEVDALILAQAGLERLGIIDDFNNNDRIKQDNNEYRDCRFCTIPAETMLPGAGQGIIAVTCKSDNQEILSILQSVDDFEVRMAATAERAFLDIVQSISPWNGRPPLAAFMSPPSLSKTQQDDDYGINNTGDESSLWIFRGLLATPDGSHVIRVRHTLKNDDCNEESAYNLGRLAGDEVVGLAGDDFLNGYY